MDKLMDNPWFIKILALLLAFLLYTAVPQGANKLTDVSLSGDQNTETIQGMPVKTYYDTNNLVVSGIPDTVDVTVSGSKGLVQSAKTLKNFEVYVDLTGAKVGTQTVKYQIKNLSSQLKATLEPAFANVSIEEKVTKEFKVDAELNNDLIEEGYVAGEPIVEPNLVKITGAKDVIDRISYVKATPDIKNSIHETTTQDARIRVMDRELNKLEVIVEPETVRVTIPVKSSSKTVPIDIVEKGTPPPGLAIDSIDLDVKDATIIGDEDILKAVANVRVEVDTSKITGDTVLTLPVIIPKDIIKVTPQLVKATIKVKKETTQGLSGLLIKQQGLGNQYKAAFKDPASGSVDMVVDGPSDILKRLKTNDFNLFVDLSNLTEGDHDVKIQVSGPSNVNWKLNKTVATVTISQTGV
ncbi:MAG: CdaR family protein [Bacillota bacterium]|nr:CdaR family protein [Bacillota bacterium]